MSPRLGFVLLSAFVLALTGCSVYSFQQRDDGWTTYTSGAGFTVDVPGPPFTETVKQLDNPNLGQLETHFLTSRASDGSRYAVVYADFPDAYVSSGADVLGEALKGDEKQLGSRAIEPHSLTVSGHPALEYGIVRTKDAWATRLVLVGRRLYALSVTGTEEAVKNEQARRFLESFSVPSG
jgi:hypothetical protein